ncbi:arsenate-mycothiol transferase ArsC, partial [[Ruminococcus] torques]|uniref:arsenate-mycothiol transferase ArsC n=1 Tax=[Ruminococcus] torques TaxID=33039 RepID=UPI0029DE0790|nr:arsenate reductase ArsC [[Ruminococcus] torques]
HFDAIDPFALRALQNARYAVAALRPKTIGDLMADDAPLDFVFTLSDAARAEPRPDWPGHPISAHWACEDPASGENDE